MEPSLIPDIVVSRLPRYLQALHHMEEEGQHATSSQELGVFLPRRFVKIYLTLANLVNRGLAILSLS